MPRIAKSDLTAALQLAAKNIVDAGGADGRTSRAELKAKLAALPPAQRNLTDIFFKFVDNRDFRAGAQVTAKDVTKAIEYAKQHMIAKYDLNGNGLSKSEIAAMSLTGKRAVELAKALKAAGGGNTGADWSTVSAQLSAAAKDVYYTSETDSSPAPIIGTPANASGVTDQNLRAAFGKKLADVFKGDDDVTNDATMGFDIKSAADSKAFLKNLETPASDEDYAKQNAAGFQKVDALLAQHLTDVRVVKVGAKDGHGGLKQDVGLYAYVVVGKTSDGKLAGVIFNSVET